MCFWLLVLFLFSLSRTLAVSQISHPIFGSFSAFAPRCPLHPSSRDHDSEITTSYTLSLEDDPGAVHHATMAGYNSMPTLSVTAGSNPDALGLGVNVNHPNAAGGLNLDAFDQDIAFDEALL